MNPYDSVVGNVTEPQFAYFQFDPTTLTQEQFKVMENDSTIHLMDFPFADPDIYGDNFAMDETKANQLKDGNVYGVTPITNMTSSALSGIYLFQILTLDTLVQPDEADTALQYEAFRQAGYTDEQMRLFGICLLKRPHGTVKYQDNELGRMEPVRGMEVWAMLFGIPFSTYTDANGYYQIP